MRRLLLTVCAVVLVDMMLYSVLTPLLPQIADDLGLAKGSAGFLVAAYAAGSFCGALPAAIVASRFGPKRAVLLGIVVMATASILFATAGSFGTLLAARFLQGSGSAISWSGAIAWLLAAAPRERRGELLGVALGTGIFGAVFGPVLGSIAALTSREAVFSAVAVLALAVGVSALAVHDAHVHEPAPGSLRRALRNPTFGAGIALMMLPALLLGVVLVLGPLHLSAEGLGAAAIGAVWLVAAVIQAASSPILGRMSDRGGTLRPVRLLLGAGSILCLALALAGHPAVYVPFLLAAAVCIGGIYAPAFALIAEGAERSGLAQGVAFALMNAAWAVGAAIGPAVAGTVAEVTGDRLPFLLAAATCLAALVFTTVRARSAAAATDGAAVR